MIAALILLLTLLLKLAWFLFKGFIRILSMPFRALWRLIFKRKKS